MRAIAVLSTLWLAAIAAAQVNPPAAIAEVLRIERVYYLEGGRKVTIEENLDPPDRPVVEVRRAPPPAAKPVPRPAAPPPVVEARAVPRPSPPVEVAAGTFRGGVRDGTGLPARHEGHNCPTCGYTSPAGQGTWVVRGRLPTGEHVHQCPQCGQVWRHGG